MSAFIVSDKHINTLVTFAGRRNIVAYHGNPTKSIATSGNEQAAAELLLAENTRSVNHRYKEDTPVTPIAFEFVNGVDAVGILKACNCLEYQSCETEDYETTAACALLKVIRETAIHELPGYSEAAWAIHN